MHFRGFIVLVLVATLTSLSGQAPSHPPYVPTPDPDPDNIPILVSDMWGRRIARFTDMGGSNWETGPTRPGDSLNAPWHISLDCNGRIYVADRDNYRIVRMDDLAGNGWKTFSGAGSNAIAARPEDWINSVSVDRAGRIYIVGAMSRIVRIDDMDGNGFVSLGPTRSGPGSFRNPKVAAFDRQGRIYVTDTDNHRIVRFDDMDGRGWTTFGTMGSGNSQFNRPEGLAIDKLGRIYITDNENSRIVRIDDMSGAGWVSFGSEGQVDPGGTRIGAEGRFHEPHDLAVADNMRIYIADTGNGRVVRLDDMTGRGWTTFGIRTRQQQPVNPACPGGNCTPPADYEFIANKGLRIDPAYLNAPAAPTGLAASPGNATLTLAWRAPADDVSSYIVEFGTATGLADIATINTGNRTTTWTTAIRDPGTYYVRVRAKGYCGKSTASNEVTATF